MENLYVLIAILVIGLVTFALRSSFLVLAGRVTFPPRLVRALRFVPAAILSAIVFPALIVGPSGASHRARQSEAARGPHRGPHRLGHTQYARDNPSRHGRTLDHQGLPAYVKV